MFTKTLLPDTLRAIQLISGISEIKGAYLAGGTALALQLGHRISVDLDFFTGEEFSESELSQKLAKIPEFAEDRIAEWTILGKIGRTKFSMFYYKYSLLEVFTVFEGINLASLADIAAMKIHAIEQRGTKRDFIDVYFLRKKYTLGQMLDFYKEKYNADLEKLYIAIRALDYFEDAEQEDQMPQMLIPVAWEEVKEFFRKEAKRLAKDKLGIKNE